MSRLTRLRPPAMAALWLAAWLAALTAGLAPGHARPGDVTLSLDGCAVPYAPHPGAVRCFDQKDFYRPRHEGVLAQIRHHGYRFVILPREPIRDTVLAALPRHRLLFEDAHTALYAVQ